MTILLIRFSGFKSVFDVFGKTLKFKKNVFY